MMLVPAAKVLARLAWLRLIRGRTLYVTGVLAVVPIVLAAIARGGAKEGRLGGFARGGLALRHPARGGDPCLGGGRRRLEQKTFTYLWSRPIPRASVIAGRLAVMTPLIFGVAALATLVSFLVAGGTTGADDLMAGLAGAGASALGCSLFAVGGGALFPRQPMLFTMGVFLTVEQFLFAIPSGEAPVDRLAHARHRWSRGRREQSRSCLRAGAALGGLARHRAVSQRHGRAGGVEGVRRRG
ncbi:MAG: hypothetical protein IPG04_37550 [Polyangiaceae bacterium]|nr:hypothetical protein [Polyangiaceae bacterium]